MEIQDCGIYLEILGFILLLLVTGRNPKARYRVDESHKESKFEIIREKIIPDKFVNMVLVIGIAGIILGLSFQLTAFNPQ